MSPAKLSQCYTKKGLKGLLKWTASCSQGDWCEWDKLIFGLGWRESQRESGRGREHLSCTCVCVCVCLFLLSVDDSNKLWHLNVSVHASLSEFSSVQISFIYLSFSHLPHFLIPWWKHDILHPFNSPLVVVSIKINYVKAVNHFTYPRNCFADSGVETYRQLTASRG